MAGSRRDKAQGAGRWQVQRERAQIADRYPLPPFRDAARIGDVVPGLFERLGVERQQWLGLLAQEWPTIVGAAVALHTRPGRMDGSRLVVFVDSAVWLHELKRYGLAKMQRSLRQWAGPERVSAVILQPDPEVTRPPDGRRGRADPEEHRRPN